MVIKLIRQANGYGEVHLLERIVAIAGVGVVAYEETRLHANPERQIIHHIDICHQRHVDIVERQLARLHVVVRSLAGILEAQFDAEVVERHIFHIGTHLEAQFELCLIAMTHEVGGGVNIMVGQFGEVDTHTRYERESTLAYRLRTRRECAKTEEYD